MTPAGPVVSHCVTWSSGETSLMNQGHGDWGRGQNLGQARQIPHGMFDTDRRCGRTSLDPQSTVVDC